VFQSVSLARHPVMSALAGENHHVWSQLTLTANLPWFYASFALHTPDGSLIETVLLSSVDQVIDLLSKNGGEISIYQLFLVSPGYLNKTDHWRMEQLNEIWQGQIGTGKYSVCLYRLADGRVYSTEEGLIDASSLRHGACLVSFKAPEAKSTQ
jgi:hypothetical protein